MTTTLLDRDPRIGDCLSINGQTVWVAYEGLKLSDEEKLELPSNINSARFRTWDCSTTTREMLLVRDSMAADDFAWTFTRPVSGLVEPDGHPFGLNHLAVHKSPPKSLLFHDTVLDLKDEQIKKVPGPGRLGDILFDLALWHFATVDGRDTLDIEVMEGVEPVLRLSSLFKGEQIRILKSRRTPPHRPWRGPRAGLDISVRFSKAEGWLYAAIIALLLWFIFAKPFAH